MKNQSKVRYRTFQLRFGDDLDAPRWLAERRQEASGAVPALGRGSAWVQSLRGKPSECGAYLVFSVNLVVYMYFLFHGIVCLEYITAVHVRIFGSPARHTKFAEQFLRFSFLFLGGFEVIESIHSQDSNIFHQK